MIKIILKMGDLNQTTGLISGTEKIYAIIKNMGVLSTIKKGMENQIRLTVGLKMRNLLLLQNYNIHLKLLKKKQILLMESLTRKSKVMKSLRLGMIFISIIKF
jgi:hypothetical protein